MFVTLSNYTSNTPLNRKWCDIVYEPSAVMRGVWQGEEWTPPLQTLSHLGTVCKQHVDIGMWQALHSTWDLSPRW